MCWFGAPLERLQATLDWLDGIGNGLFDVVFDDGCNPISVCRQALAQMLCGGSSGPCHPWYSSCLAPIIEFFAEFSHQVVAEACAEVGVDLDAQVFWRFLVYQDFPYRWAAWLHPRVSEQEAIGVTDEFFERELCCLNRESSVKIYNHFNTAARSKPLSE